nr:pectinesterase-like [Tanacetum cinerariifolium]
DGSLDDIHFMNTKALKTMCKPTDYKDLCYEALADVSKDTSSTKKDYIFASFNNLLNCEKLLSHAVCDLQHVVKVATKTKTKKLIKQVDPILVWLTAARAYQTTCVDEITDEKLKKDIKKTLDAANKHTFNSEKIIYNVPKILKDFGVDLSDYKLPPIGHRRLLDEGEELDQQGYPSWVTASDRRILGGDSKDEDDDDEKSKKDDHVPKPKDFFKSPEPEPLKKDVKPDVVVAQDGSGQFKTIREALDNYPRNLKGRYIIYIKCGEYDEQIIVNRQHHNVYMYGDGQDKTIISGNANHGVAEITISNTATFVAEGERFMAKCIGFKNTIGPRGGEAVAFRSQSPHTVMVDCSFEGYQNTLYYHTHYQFYKNCEISGTVDIIFGSGRAFFQDTKINVRKPQTGQSNTITADGRMKTEEMGGVVLHNCKIMAAPELKSAKGQFKTYLGRPWKEEAKAIVMKSELGDVIQAGGWTAWETPDEKDYHETCMLREYGNKGPGSNTDGRVTWSGYKVIEDEDEAENFSSEKFIDAKSWVPLTGVPINLKL